MCSEICIRTQTTALGSKLGARHKNRNISKSFKRSLKKIKKRGAVYGLLFANVAVLAAAVIFVVNNSTTVSSSPKSNLLAESASTVADNPLDQLSSADIAAHVASLTRMTEVNAVRNQADTESSQLAVTPADEKVVTKPQLVATARKSNKDIQSYVTVSGDTVSSVAAKFGVSSENLKLSNSITGENIASGTQLFIPPNGMNALVYVVKSGDTPDKLAETYRTNKEAIIAFNDAEVAGLKTGTRILIPDGTRPVTRYAAAANTGIYSGSSFAWGGGAPVYGGANGYDYGYCTWYAAIRRAQSGRPVPSNLGNASSWKVLAARAGFGVGNAPAAGAVIWTPPRDYYGHVGYVESVDPDGTVHVSEMNVAGWGRVSSKTLTPAQAAAYGYIY